MQQQVEDYLGREIADIIRAQIAPLQQRIIQLESRVPEKGERGERGSDGASGAPGPQGDKGERGDIGPSGLDGKSIDIDAMVATLVPLIEQKIEKLFIDYPKPIDGKNGIDGVNGKDGKDGASGKDGIDGVNGISPDVADVAALVMKSIQLPQDGKNGRDGVDGKDGKDADPNQVAAQVIKSINQLPWPKDGKDGIGLAGAVIDRDGQLIITKTDGGTHNLGIVVGRDGAQGIAGKDGVPGRDGFGFDDMEAIEDGLKFGHRFRRGDLVKEFWFNKPTLADFDHEIFREGNVYPRGAVVSSDGSLFICKEETKQRPGIGKAWRLAVKRGKDGKDGRDGKDGLRGERGPAGQNATVY